METITEALKWYGVAAVPGKLSNQKVLDFFRESGFNWVENDDTAWCAAFVGAVLNKCDLPTTKSLLARSYLEIGVQTDTPSIGDLVILWRIAKEGIYGHVGFYISNIGNTVYVLGGNTDGMVEIKGFSKDQLLGYRQIIIK
jgi:uncharacterized protein (TIGR02594 family)